MEDHRRGNFSADREKRWLFIPMNSEGRRWREQLPALVTTVQSRSRGRSRGCSCSCGRRHRCDS